MSLNILRQQITQVIEGVAPGDPNSRGISTSVAALDALLPSNGIPRGRLTELLGAQGTGRTTLLRRIVQTAVSEGLWVAYIDATRTLAPRNWAHIGSNGNNHLWVIRPPSGDRGAWCADLLLRSGAFSLVVLDGAAVLSRSIAVRLSLLARDSNAAFIVTGDERSATMLGGALRLRVKAVRAKWRAPPSQALSREKRFSIGIEKGGNPKAVEVCCAIGVESRLCAHPEIPDRRGVGTRRSRSGTTETRRGTTGNSECDEDHSAIATLPTAITVAGQPYTRSFSRKRRFAEPEIQRGTLTEALG